MAAGMVSLRPNAGSKLVAAAFPLMVALVVEKMLSPVMETATADEPTKAEPGEEITNLRNWIRTQPSSGEINGRGLPGTSSRIESVPLHSAPLA